MLSSMNLLASSSLSEATVICKKQSILIRAGLVLKFDELFDLASTSPPPLSGHIPFFCPIFSDLCPILVLCQDSDKTSALFPGLSIVFIFLDSKFIYINKTRTYHFNSLISRLLILSDSIPALPRLVCDRRGIHVVIEEDIVPVSHVLITGCHHKPV